MYEGLRLVRYVVAVLADLLRGGHRAVLSLASRQPSGSARIGASSRPSVDPFAAGVALWLAYSLLTVDAAGVALGLAAAYLCWVTRGKSVRGWAAGGLALAATYLAVGTTGLLLLVVLAGAGLAALPGSRDRLRGGRERWQIRQKWQIALGHSGLRPYVGTGDVWRVPSGWRVQLSVTGGRTLDDVEGKHAALATSLGARDVLLQRDPNSAGHGVATIVLTDQLADSPAVAWPAAPSVWDGIPVGRDENGETVRLSLPYASLLIGGTPGSGKSSALQMIVAAAAADPATRLFLIDGKRVELGPWRHRAERFASDPADALAVLRYVRDEMRARYDYLDRAPGVRRKIERRDDFPLLLLVVDELAIFTADGVPGRADFDAVLGDLVKLGRAAGVVAVLATQKPSADVISTQVRDNVGLRWAMRTATPEATVTILGDREPPAHELPRVPGIGYLTTEDGTRTKLRTFHLTDAQIEELIGDPPLGVPG